MFLILLTAPLFHFHDRDDHGNPASLVHAHFEEFTEADFLHSGPEVELPHSHGSAHWIDFFVNKVPAGFSGLAIELSEKLSGPILEVRRPIAIPSNPLAHGPPGSASSRPRSPPSV